MRNLLSVVSVSAICAASVLVSGCFPVVATGVVGGALSITDRRTTGAQAEDQVIELKAFNRFRERFKSDKVSLTVTSFNRVALLTGVVPDDATKAEAARVLGQIDNVRSVINEVYVGPPASIRAYGSDVVLTTRVKASLLEAKDIQATVIKVLTESSIVYLMGIVTEREAARATNIASRVSGVRRVVRAFEIVTDSELARIQLQTGGTTNPPAPASPAPSSRTSAPSRSSATASPSAAPATPPSSSSAPSASDAPVAPSASSGSAMVEDSGITVTPIR